MTTEDQNIIQAIDGLSAYLEITKSIRYKLAQKRTIPGQKIGKHWRFKKYFIDQWFADIQQTTNRKQYA